MVDEQQPPKGESSIRLPDELVAKLRRIAGEHLSRGAKPPRFGDLLLEAWRAYERQLEYGERGIIESGDQPVVKTGEVPVQLDKTPDPSTVGVIKCLPVDCTPHEQVWLRKTLQVLRSTKPELSTILKYSINEMSEAATRYERERSPDAPAGGSPTGDDRGPSALDAAIEEAARDRGRSEAAIQEAEEAAKAGRGREKRDRRKDRGRR